MAGETRQVHFGLGFNFDRALVEGIAELRSLSQSRVIAEVFGALPDCPISSARPTSRIPVIPWNEFRSQVADLAAVGVGFNFLMNTSQACEGTLRAMVREYLMRLVDAGVTRLTAGSPALCNFVKAVAPNMHVTMSITYGARSVESVTRAAEAGADAIYLDGVYVNRDFQLLRELIGRGVIECRLYANMSCIAGCPVVRQHYAVFAGPQDARAAETSDAFFAGCSLVKLRNPVEWIQVPWIRPEDIEVYLGEGIRHFKLADRLAPTAVLLQIAAAYLSGKSTPNLFYLMERDGAKYRRAVNPASDPGSEPMLVRSDRIPADFVEHFRNGDCRSRDLRCPICSKVAHEAVTVGAGWEDAAIKPDLASVVPPALLKRTGL